MSPDPSAAASASPTAALALGFPPGRAIIVTGGARGIGGAVATLATRMGLTVAVWDVDGDAATAMAATLGGAALSQTVDVTDGAAVDRALTATVDAVGVPAYLVNNAGPASSEQKTLHGGVDEALRAMGLVTERWLALDLPDGAALCNTASIAGIFLGGAPWYAAAKGAIAGWTRALAATVGPRVRVNTVAPGFIETRRTVAVLDAGGREDLAARAPLRRHGQPEEVAGAILFLLSPLASYVTGAVVPVDGGLIVQ